MTAHSRHSIGPVYLTVILLVVMVGPGCTEYFGDCFQDPPTSDTSRAMDTSDFIDTRFAACTDAPFPNCKADGVCSAMSELGLPQVWACNEETGQWKCDYSILGEIYQNKETLCDGLDNDCDGDTDEIDDVDFADACPDLNNGVCSGTPEAVDITCVEVGAGFEFLCDAAAVPDYAEMELFDPQAETPGQLCDNQDNDCDGETDEDHEYDGGLDPLPGVTWSLCQEFSGICHAAVTNEDPYQANGDVIFRCNEGGMECVYDFVENFDAPESLCDGVDNDCNGETDEVTDITESDCPHQGICEGRVTAFCMNGGWICDMTEVLADPAFQFDETRCDYKDNDCDGMADEGMDWESVVAARCDGTCADPFCETWNEDCEGSITPEFSAADKCPIMGPGTFPGSPSVPVLGPTGGPILPGVCDYDSLTGVTDVLLHCMEYDHLNDGLIDGAFYGCRYDAMEAGDDPSYTADESPVPVDGYWCDNLDNDCDGNTDEGCP